MHQPAQSRQRGSYTANLLGNIRSHLAGLQGYDVTALELIQNADDARAEEIVFDITDDGLVVRNSGEFTYCGDLSWVRLFFVEKFSPYSWAFLPADASLQCSVRGDSNQASTYPRLSGGQPSLETVPNTVGLSPSGALPSGHSRGVLVRFHGQGDRPVMALTTGFQGRRFDVPEARTGVPRIDLPSPAPCAAADAVFADAKAFLSSNEARQMSESGRVEGRRVTGSVAQTGPQSEAHRHVSSPRSPNPACRFPAPGSPVESCGSHTGFPARPAGGFRGAVAPGSHPCAGRPGGSSDLLTL